MTPWLSRPSISVVLDTVVSSSARRAATSFSAFTGATTLSASPWNTISGTGAPGPGVPPVRMAAKADATSCAAPYAMPECTPTAAYSSGCVAAMTADMAPPAESPAT